MRKDPLEQLRKQLKKKDEEILTLLNERANIAIEVGRLKRKHDLRIYDPTQESKIHHYLHTINTGPLTAGSLKTIFTEIISASRALQEPLRVAYLGPEASFTHLAAESHFGKGTVFSPQLTISDVFDQVEKGRVHCGVVPVENSLEGAVTITLDRLISTPVDILNEIYLPISHVLLSTRNTHHGVKRVYSHPQALAQCKNWIRQNLPRSTCHDAESTAKAAAMVLEDADCAAIGSRRAASAYGLNIIAEGIEDHGSNTTRFVVIGEGENAPTGRDKTSIIFGVRHEPGALQHSLSPFAEKEINLMKIVSHPIRERMWEYLFFVDFMGHLMEDKTTQCLKALKDECTFIKILGSYPMGDAKL